jgi:uncharacterized delta-60 repeat protein
MATYTWIGAAGGLYATTTNWSPTGLPAAADDIVFTGDASPSVGTTARTVRHVTVQAGTVTFAGTGAFTIQGDINNSGTLNMNTFTTNFTGGNSQTLNLGTNSFASCTINKTNGTLITLGAAWNVTGTATATLTVTNGNLTTQGYTVTCRAFLASGNTDRTITLNSGAIYVTGTSGTLWNTSHTTAAGTAWTKFDRTGTAYIQPSGGTTGTITGGGIAGNYTAGATFNGVPPNFVLDNNKTYTTTGQFENLIVNGNFAGTSTPQIWGSLTGVPVSANNVTTCNPVLIGRTGIEVLVDWRAQVTSYTTQNPLSGTPSFQFYYARAVTFNCSSNTSTYSIYIDGGDTTIGAWQTPAFTLNCNGNNSTYTEHVVYCASTLTYNGNGTSSSYQHSGFTDNNTASAITFGGNTSTTHRINTFDSLGTVTFNIGTLILDTPLYCRIFASATGSGLSGNVRTWNFQQNWIYVNGNHRSGTNGTGTLTVATLNNTVCSSDVNNQNGGFWLQTTGTCATGSWPDSGVPNMIVEALGGTTLNASINNCNVRNLTFYGPVNFATSQTVNLINSSTTVAWNESGAAFNLNNLTATIACATGGTFDILRNGSSLGNANYRLGTLSTLNTSLGDNQTVTILGYVRTLSLTKNTGTFNLNDLDFAQTITCSGTANTNYYYNNVRNNNPFTTTWTPITGTAVTAAVTVTQVGVKSTSGSGSGASFNVTKAVNQLTYGSATITVAALGDGYVVGDTITLSGANLGGADGTNDLTFTITAATQATLSGISDSAVTASISGTAVNTAQTRTNVPVKSTSGSGTGALFSVTKTGTGVVYFGVTTIIRTTDGSGYNYGDTITLSGLDIGGVDGTNDLTFTFGQATEHYVTGGSNFVCENTLDHTAGDLEISAARTMYCRIFQSTSTTNIRNWRWNGWVQTSGTGFVSIGSAGANIRGNFLDTYSGGFVAIGTGVNAFGTNVGANAPRVYLGTNDGSVRTYTSVNGNISHLMFYSNDYTFASASGPTVYGNCSFNYNWLQGYGTWTNLTVNWQPIRNGADLQLYSGWNWEYFGNSPIIPAITLNTPLGIADAGATITIGVKCNTFTSTTTHNYTVNTAGAGLQVGTSISITGNNCTFNFNTIGSHYTVANPTFTLGAATSTNNFYNIGVGYFWGPQIEFVDFTQLAGTTTFLYATTIRDYTFTGPGTLNLSPNYITLRNFSSSNSNARTLNFNNLMHTLTGTPTISTGTNLVVQNPGGFTVSGSGTINLSGINAASDNNFNIAWITSCTFTTASVIRNLYIYSGAVLSTSSAITVNIRGTVTSPDNSGGTGPFTGMTISFPQVSNPGSLNQEYNVITATVIPSVTVLGSCTVSAIRTTTLTLSPGSGYTAIFNPSGHVTTLTCGGSNGGTVTLNNLHSLTTIPTTVSFTGGATYNLNGLTSSATSVSCGGTTGAVYNINTLDLSGTATANRLLFDGNGTLNVGTSVNLGNFSITNSTLSRTLNFGTNFINIKSGGLISCALGTTTVSTTTEKHSLSDAGGIRVPSGSGTAGTLTVTGQTENNALNLLLDGTTVTLGGTLAWRNIVTSTDSYFGQGGGVITNTTGTLTIYGDYFVRVGEGQSGSVVNWAALTVNFAGTDASVPQFISTNGWYGANIGPLTSTMSGASPKILGEWTHGGGPVFIKTLTVNNATVIIPRGRYLACDSITVNGGTFKAYGPIYVNNWNTSNTATYYWEGEEYLRIGEAPSTNPGSYGYSGNTTWNSAKVFNSTNTRGAGTGPNLIMRDGSEGYYTYASANSSNSHRVKNLYLAGTSYTNANLVFKVSESVFNQNSSDVSFGNLKLIFDSSSNASNNLSVDSSYNMSNSNPLPVLSMSSNSMLSVLPTSSNVSFSTLGFSGQNYTLKTNSKNISTTSIQANSVNFGNSTVTLYNDNQYYSETGVIFDSLNEHNSLVTATKNYSSYFTYTPSLEYITVLQNAAPYINLSNSSFTIECWIWPEESYSTQLVWPEGNGSSNRWPQPRISLISKKSTFDVRSKTTNWELFLEPWTSYPGFNNGTNNYISSTKVLPKTWNHIAATFDNSSTTLTIYLNGANVLQTSMSGVSHTNNVQLMIGDYFKGYIKDVRIVKNAVVYNSTFENSLPTAPLEIHSSGTTELLTCQNSTLVDNSSSPKTLSDTTLSRYLFSPTTFQNNSEIIVTGSDDKTINVLDDNINIITNNNYYNINPIFTQGTGLSSSSFSIAIQTDGKIVVGGGFTSYDGTTQNRITRLYRDGTRDTGFNIGTGFIFTVYAIAIQTDGKILVGGSFSSYNGTTQNFITRLNSDGTRDTGFNIGTGFSGDFVNSIAIQTDGKILVGGGFTSYNGTTQNFITRLNSDGTRDTGFSIGTGFNAGVNSIAIQTDGKIVVGGDFSSYNGTTQNCITRLNSNGTRDTGFSIGTGFNNSLYEIAIQTDGKILVGGGFTSYDGTTQTNITRLNSDGTRDTGFSIGTGFNAGVNSIAIQTDDKIVVGGGFTSYDGTTQNRITRLNSDGTRDTGFNIGTGFSGVVQSIAIQTDGKIVIGGSFTSYNGTTQNRITRLNSDGGSEPPIGWLTLAHTGNKTINTVRTGSGNFSKAFKTS